MKVVKSGYGIELRGRVYFEVTFSNGLFLRTKFYKTLSDLQAALPAIFQLGSHIENIRPFNYKGHHLYGIFDNKNSRLAFTLIDNIRHVASQKEQYRSEIAAFFGQQAETADFSPVLLRDESSDAVYIETVVDLLAEIARIPQKKDHVFYFRGHSSYWYKMEPGIYRKTELIHNEDIIFKELSIRCPADFSDIRSTFDMLVKMQHYSCPTRLLDLTTNPLVALYFACEQPIEKNGLAEIKLLSIPKDEIKYYDSDTASVLSNLALQPSDFNLSCLADESSQSHIHYLDDIRKEKPYFTARVQPSSAKSVICVKPKLNNARIMRQDGAFLLFGIDGEKQRLPKVPNKYLSALGRKRLLIKESERESILQQLERVGISAATIYPEIDKVSNYISAKYGKPVEQDDVLKDIAGDADQ